MTQIDNISKKGTIESMRPYLYKLWLPLLVYSLIEVGFKLIGYSISHNIVSATIIESLAFVLRCIFEVSLLTQLMLLFQGQKAITFSQIWHFPLQKNVSNLTARILSFAAFILPIFLLSLLLNSPDFNSGNPQQMRDFSHIIAYALVLAWLYAVVYFTVNWWFSTQVVVYENRGPIASLDRSHKICMHHWWEVLATIIHAVLRGLLVMTVVVCALGILVAGFQVFIQSLHQPGVVISRGLLYQSTSHLIGQLFMRIVTGFPMQGYLAIALTAKFFQVRERPVPS